MDVDALMEILSLSVAERAAMGERGRQLVARRFSWEVVRPQFLSVYRWLVDGGARPETVRASG
jgi:glycosyltransferase involved in cell wall biosynthesis